MTIYGWDLSHYDAPDSRRAVAEGFSFFTHKAGGDKDDAEIAQWWTYMKPLRSASVLLGAYWVQYPGNPVARADAFLARLDATCPGWRDGPFILQADCEIWNGNPATKPGKAEIEAFCDRLVSRMPKLRPIVYAPPWAYHDELTGLGYPLWASRYVTGSGYASVLYPGDTSAKWAAYSGQTPAILQFTSSATIAGQTTCDANAYRGTIAQLTALVAPGWETNMSLTADDKTWLLANLGPAKTWAFPLEDPASTTTPKATKAAGTYVRYNDVVSRVGARSGVLELVEEGILGGPVDPAAMVAQILAGLDPQRIADLVAAALPADQAKAFADELAARLAA